MKEDDSHALDWGFIRGDLERIFLMEIGAGFAWVMRMRYLLVIIVLAAVYLFLVKRNAKQPEPVVNATPAPAHSATPSPGTTPGTNVFKRPLDRTHEVIDQVQKNKESF